MNSLFDWLRLQGRLFDVWVRNLPEWEVIALLCGSIMLFPAIFFLFAGIARIQLEPVERWIDRLLDDVTRLIRR